MTNYCIRSKCLPIITEALKKMSIMEDDFSATPPKMNQNGEFESNITTSQDNVEIPGADVEKQEEPKTREELISMATEKLKASIDIASELDEIISQIRTLSEEEPQSNEWVANEDANDVYLASKDAHIFVQNDNILLSHDGHVEVFHSVQELHQWLKENNYPLPPAVEIHESAAEDLRNRELFDPKIDSGWYVFSRRAPIEDESGDDIVVKGPMKTEEEAKLWIDMHFGDNPLANCYIEYVGGPVDA